MITIKTLGFWYLILSSIALSSCRDKKSETEKDFVPSVVDLAIRLRNDQPIELSTLYDSLISIIPADSSEKIFLAEELKRRGFKVVDWGRGNILPKGVRIVSMSLTRDECYCSVNKIYYSTIEDNLYQVHESISCKDSLNK